jgi:dTDP-glucose 4,6-dehydratase
VSRLLVTGGAGFIGSNFVRLALTRWPDEELVVYDALTYAGNLANLDGILDDQRVTFVHGDIRDAASVRPAMSGCSRVVNFAAETHVDRSILDPSRFVETDVEGTRVLLETARDEGVTRYLQVSTDEVYGDVEPPHRSTETDPLQPRSPYSASKAGGDLMVGAYHATFGVPTLITRGSNTYGPYQFPEKLIPLFITNALRGLPLPIYGDGMQMREWLAVADHCSGIATVLDRGTPGEVYNLGAGNERPNLEVIESIVRLTGADRSLLRHVPDRLGHDRRYALDSRKARGLGWAPAVQFEDGLATTVTWYREHRDWWEPIVSGEFRDYYQQQYAARLGGTEA